MENTTLWWLVVGALVAVEMITGTFYLLMLATGGLAGALAAYLGASLPVQLVLAALVGIASASVWHLYRMQNTVSLTAGSDPSANLDVGETVHVTQWADDGSAQVAYRGANWTAVAQPEAPPQPGAHTIVEVQGNRLVLRKKI